jgi:hypothetical protein
MYHAIDCERTFLVVRQGRIQLGKMPSENALRIIRDGNVRLKVRRGGMLQFQVFKIRKVRLGGEEFVELFLDRVLDASELMRVAEETGLPVEAENGRAFPTGKGAKDFIGF